MMGTHSDLGAEMGVILGHDGPAGPALETHGNCFGIPDGDGENMNMSGFVLFLSAWRHDLLEHFRPARIPPEAFPTAGD